MSEYIPILISSLKSDTIIGCDLYVLSKKDGKSNYVLYSSGDSMFEGSKKSMLARKNIKSIFINKKDKKFFYEYLESNFQQILSYENSTPGEKAQLIRDTANNLVQDLFVDPGTGNIKRTKQFAYNMVDYVLKDSRTSHSLVSLATQQYYTYAHSVNVASVGTLFASSLGIKANELRPLCLGMLLHDIGKSKISKEILEKKGKLTDDEFAIIRQHPEMGAEILNKDIVFKDEYMITLHHHENCDGSGYPFGLKKKEVHTYARMVRILDIYDALTSDRSYADANQPFGAVQIMARDMSNIVDTNLLAKFVKFLGGYR